MDNNDTTRGGRERLNEQNQIKPAVPGETRQNHIKPAQPQQIPTQTPQPSKGKDS